MKYGQKQIDFFKNKSYLKGNETLEERITDIVNVVKNYEGDYSEGLSERIRFYIENQILSLSTPQWANLGREADPESNTQPLNCSCNIVTYPNSIAGIYYAHGEVAMLSKLGAGVGTSWLNVAQKATLLEEGFHTNPKLDWIEDSVRASQKVSQNSVRRGYSVPFISIEDREFYDVLERADKKNPDKNDPLVKNNVGVILTSGFWERLKTDKELQKRFLLVIQQRKSKGKIYLLDVDNCNKNQSPVYEKLGHSVDSTNICSEITTPSYDDKTFACILSSLNLKYWDIIKKDPQIIKDCFMFLDINVEEYIRLTKDVPFLEKAHRSALEKRDIGLGTLGFHEYLQSKECAFGDVMSRSLNKEIYSTIRKYGEEVTKEMGEKLGSPKLCQEAGLTRRNVSLMMIAPNKSTAYLCGETSLGIEPFMSNYFAQDLAGKHSTFKNPYLEKVLEKYGKNTVDVWNSISKEGGSVAHLDFLSQNEKDVFKTATEIAPKDIIDLASDRQVSIDMAQSLNLFSRPQYTVQDVYNIHKYAFDKGIKTLYYFYPSGHASIEKTTGESWDACVSCAD